MSAKQSPTHNVLDRFIRSRIAIGHEVEGGPVKRVEHHGGVSFRIPTTWIEEHEENTGVYYEDDNGTGTLHLTVMTARRPQANIAGDLDEFMRDTQRRKGGRLQFLANGKVLWRYTVATIEDGQKLIEHHWERRWRDKLPTSYNPRRVVC
jgi:hypothetical protein